MGESFTKLQSSILHSTVWFEDDKTLRVWITLLAMADANGYVGASIPGLAHQARVPIEAVEAALARFHTPDPYSRSQEHEGRRIETVDRGWQLLNYRRIRDGRDDEARRTYERERKREQRQRSRSVPDSPGQSEAVPQGPDTPAERKPPRKPKGTEPEDVAAVLDAIDEERRRSGVPNAKRKTPAPAATIKAVKTRLAEVGLERVMRVVRRKGVDCRQRPIAVISGSETRTVRFLTAVSIMRPDNFARMDEADELDEASAADRHRVLEFRTERDGTVMARTSLGWRQATESERGQYAEAT